MKKIWGSCLLSLMLISPLMANAASSSAQPLDKIVAVVNDGVITQNELMAQVNLIREQLAHRQTTVPPLKVMQKQVLNHMIDVEIQLQMAKRAGIKIEPKDVDASISKIAERNHIDLAKMRQLVEAQGVNWAKYHDNVAKEMTIAQVQQKAIGRSVIVTKQQVEDFQKKNPQTQTNNQEYHLQDILIPLPEAPTPTQIQDAQQKTMNVLQKIKQGSDFSQIAVAESSGETALQGGDLGYRKLAALPEIFATKVVKMRVTEVAGPIRSPNGFHIIKLVDVKGGDTQRFVTLTHVRHILLKVDAGNSSSVVKRKLTKVRQEIIKGTEFWKLAEKYSQDPLSAAKGGDLGWVHPGEVVPNFEIAMNQLQPGQVSQPVNTQFGWHLIKVEGRKQIDDSKEYQKLQVRQMLYRRKFNEAAQNWLQEMRSRAYIKIML